MIRNQSPSHELLFTILSASYTSQKLITQEKYAADEVPGNVMLILTRQSMTDPFQYR
jgi:hypothetical protein